MDLIDRQAAIELFVRREEELCQAIEAKTGRPVPIRPRFAERIASELKKLPTIEAEPVKHGRWEYDSYEMERFCSACSRAAILGESAYILTEYCPNCGAKMDLEG